MAAALISKPAFLALMAAALLPAMGAAQTPAAPAATTPDASNSRWVQLPNIHLEDVLYPAAVAGGTTPVANVLGTSSSTLRSGHTVLATTIRLDNPEPRGNGVRPSDYVRCYEYFSLNFSQDGTRCFVLQPRK